MPMAIDVYSTNDHVTILAAVPGMSPEDLDLTIHENTITISGTIPNVAESEETKGATWYVHELWSGEVRRSLMLPFAVDSDRADAKFENGILRISLPKADERQATQDQGRRRERPAGAGLRRETVVERRRPGSYPGLMIIASPIW